MRVTMQQRTALDHLLDAEAAANGGHVQHAAYTQRVLDYCQDEIEQGRGDELLAELAGSLAKTMLRGRAWRVQPGPEQLSLYEPDALLALGDGSSVRMADATEQNLRDYNRVLDSNFKAQSGAYFAKRDALATWADDLRVRGGTLGQLLEGDA